jgi:hypothetical protein
MLQCERLYTSWLRSGDKPRCQCSGDSRLQTFSSRFPSDHRSYFLDFDTQKLFGTDTQTLGKHSDRILRSNNLAQTTQYIQAKYDLLLQHNAFARGDQLSLPGEKHEFAERLDLLNNSNSVSQNTVLPLTVRKCLHPKSWALYQSVLGM